MKPDVVRRPAVPALLDNHLLNERIEVIIRTADGQEFDVSGLFRDARIETDVAEISTAFQTEYIPTERHFYLHLVGITDVKRGITE